MGLKPKYSKILWGQAAGRCMKPNCRQGLPRALDGIEPYHIGEEAHILPDGSKGPRHADREPSDDTDSLENYLLLCANCHTEIDKAPAQFPVLLLRDWRATHVEWVHDVLEDHLSRVTFEELAIVTESIADHSGSRETDEDLQITPPPEKMSRNGLSARLRGTIAAALSQAGIVKRFLADFEENDPDFPDRLIGGLRSEYHAGLARGLRGDELYQHLATHSSSDLALQSAQGMVVAYLFHTCDLFEP